MCNLVLIKGNSSNLKKFDIYFKGTITRAFLDALFAPTVYGAPNKLDLYLKDFELIVLTLEILPASSKGCFGLSY